MINHTPNDNPGILWLVLSPAARQRLQDAHPPLYENDFYHHVTLAFDVPRQSVEQFIGRPAVVQAYAHVADANVQAVRVATDPQDNLPDTYGVPHITLSTAAGIEPFAAVAMIKGDHTAAPIDPPLQIDGTVEFFLFEEE